MEKYIALLRGINISGKNKIKMQELKKEFEQIGYENVITYLNSGNVIFSSSMNDKNIISDSIHSMIESKFNINIPVYVMKEDELAELFKNKPDWWGNQDKDIYDNIIFIIPPYTFKQVYNELGNPKEEYEKIQEYKNNIFWSYDLKNYRKTNWWAKTASTDIKDFITIRTANTMRKVLEICLVTKIIYN